MSFSLTGNFFANARGVTFVDGGGVTWAFNPNTNAVTATAVGGGGGLTSVGLADDSTTPIYTVSNSPLVANGTLGITLNTQNENLVFAGPSTGAAAQPGFRALVPADVPTLNQNTTGNAATATNVAYSGLTGSVPTWNQNTTGNAAGLSNTLAVGSGGTGAITLTGYVIGNGTSAFTASATIPYSALSGTPSIPAAANPTGTIGLSAVNGSLTTFLRSDGAPALSQAIVPTWTGAHTFSALLTANLGITVAGATTKVAAGTTSIAPLTFQSGTNLTAAAAGAAEYDGTNLYFTNETTSGRGLVPAEQYFHLAAAGSGITTIANFFGTTSNISLVSGGYYEIEIILYYTMGATGSVVTWTLTNSAAPTAMDLWYEMCPVTGIVAPPGTATMLVGQILGGVTAAQTVVTGALTGGTNQYARFRIMLKNGTGTSLKIQATETTQTTSLTPKIGSYWKCKRIPAGNVGTFAA